MGLRILFLASQFPFPADSGATIKSLSIVEHLRRRRHEVRLIALTSAPLTREQEKWSVRLGGARTVQHSSPRNAWTLIRSYLARVPLSIERTRNAEMTTLVEAEVEDFRPDVVLADGWLMAQYVPDGFGGRKLLHEHNAEHELWDRQAELEGGLRRLLARREAGRVRRYEAGLLRRFDTTFVVSPDDRRALGKIGGDLNRIKVLPNIPDATLLEEPAPSFKLTEPVVLYFGTLSWQPNIEGLQRYLSFGHKQIVKRAPASILLVAGKGASPELVRRMEQTSNVEFLGEVEEAEELYKRARVAVDSSRSGGGTRLKILNALARGIPVVASSEAARGLDIVPGEHLIVARNEHALIDGVTSLLQDEERWRVLSQNGRALIRAKYVPETAFEALDQTLARISKAQS